MVVGMLQYDEGRGALPRLLLLAGAFVRPFADGVHARLCRRLRAKASSTMGRAKKRQCPLKIKINLELFFRVGEKKKAAYACVAELPSARSSSTPVL